jgi:two-component system response regulator PilR (NtrC family)
MLVVDDDQKVADLLVSQLQALNYSAEAVYDGREALNRISREDFHVLITDVIMPGITGMQLLEAGKKANDKLIVILITGYATIEMGVKALKMGAFDYMAKPYLLEELEMSLRMSLENRYGSLEPRLNK